MRRYVSSLQGGFKNHRLRSKKLQGYSKKVTAFENIRVFGGFIWSCLSSPANSSTPCALGLDGKRVKLQRCMHHIVGVLDPSSHENGLVRPRCNDLLRPRPCAFVSPLTNAARTAHAIFSHTLLREFRKSLVAFWGNMSIFSRDLVMVSSALASVV